MALTCFYTLQLLSDSQTADHFPLLLSPAAQPALNSYCFECSSLSFPHMLPKTSAEKKIAENHLPLISDSYAHELTPCSAAYPRSHSVLCILVKFLNQMPFKLLCGSVPKKKMYFLYPPPKLASIFTFLNVNVLLSSICCALITQDWSHKSFLWFHTKAFLSPFLNIICLCNLLLILPYTLQEIIWTPRFTI